MVRLGLSELSCSPITPVQFKTAKPQFSAVGDALVQTYIDLAQVWATADWPDSLCLPVQVSLVCHLMTLDGLGSDSRSRNFGRGTNEYQSVRTGSVTLTRFRSSAERAGLSTGDWFSQTPCGQQFMVFVRMFMSGARWVGTPYSAGVTPYAKDAYRDGWWLC